MKQNLIKAICPCCGKKVLNIIGIWVDVVNKKAVPANLPEERCPVCKKEEEEKKLLQTSPLMREQ